MTASATQIAASIYEFVVRTIDGEEMALERYRGRVMLVVNVASRCGFTSQYAGLELLHRKYADRGLVVLGFPCNQFAQQEPEDESAIKAFCSTTYQVTFPLFAKIDVNGPQAHPLYRWLKHQARGVLGSESIKWNFTKFLVDRSGAVVNRVAPSTTPEDLEPEIVRLLD